MHGREEHDVEDYIARLLGSNELEDLDTWMQIVSSAEFAISTNQLLAAGQLYKLALDYAEQNMSAEVVVNTLLCMSTLYRRQERINEADAAYARAIALFQDTVETGEW